MEGGTESESEVRYQNQGSSLDQSQESERKVRTSLPGGQDQGWVQCRSTGKRFEHLATAVGKSRSADPLSN